MWRMQGWQLQASNDMQKWIILDKRYYEGINFGSQCWAIRDDVQQVYPQGFSAFRIVQTHANSNLTHNLCIS
jgi:hypothetical protein